MSIFTGKDGYNSTAAWAERSAKALRERGSLYRYDAGTEDDACVPWVMSKVSGRPDVLEIGSGFGKWARVLRGKYSSFTGVDIIADRVRHAQEAFSGQSNVSFKLVSGGWDLGRTFPLILCITVIQHLTVPDAVVVLRAIERHLAPSGIALLAEGRIIDCSIEAAEQRYAMKENSAHMIPKPLALLKEATPSLAWTVESDTRFVLSKA